MKSMSLLSFPLVLVLALLLWLAAGGPAAASQGKPDHDDDAHDDDDGFPLVQQCSPFQGGGVCPLKNTCCPIRLSNGTISSGCIPSDLGASKATCCADQRTGCGVGYQCVSVKSNSNGQRQQQQCQATSAISDPFVQVLPRYPLCHWSPFANFRQVHRLASPSKFPMAQMLYYSSHGDLLKLQQQQAAQQIIRHVLIVIHGANRNADDYFCAASAAVAVHTHGNPERVLLLAPRFVVPRDLPVEMQKENILQWNGSIADGAWRYGANAVAPETAKNVSSFDVLDALVETVHQKVGSHTNNVPITIAGHSSGGQFVQRWALVSEQAQHVHAMVVANPSSFAYLTAERFHATTKTWQVPDAKDDCHHRYNQWEWGLETTVDETPDYVRRVLQEYNTTTLIERFATRPVVYLVGSLDRCNVSSSSSSTDQFLPNFHDDATTAIHVNGWCNSHGLETTCMDQWQGTNRWERNARYMEMLERATHHHHHHKRVVVPGVGHDHSLMLSSPQGLQVLFPSSSFSFDHDISLEEEPSPVVD